MPDPTSDELQVRADALRTEIVTHEGALASARSPRARLSHRNKLTDAKSELAKAERTLNR